MIVEDYVVHSFDEAFSCEHLFEIVLRCCCCSSMNIYASILGVKYINHFQYSVSMVGCVQVS